MRYWKIGILALLVAGIVIGIYFIFKKNSPIRIVSLTMQITSPTIEQDGELKSLYTCDGTGVTPPLAFGGIPESAKSVVLFLDDPDTSIGTFDHWVIWNIPATTTAILEGETPQGVVGKNSLGQNNYVPPCPPTGQHRYIFHAYALDTLLDLPSDSSKALVEKAMEGHVLDSAELKSRYQRR